MRKSRNFTFEYIQAANVDAYEKSYLELAARKVDVFLAVGNEPALRAALSAARGAPIAFLAIDFDPLAKGYVASLSRPGGNVTGIFVRQLELAAKRVEIAREVFFRPLLLSGSHLIQFRASSAMRRPMRPANQALSRRSRSRSKARRTTVPRSAQWTGYAGGPSSCRQAQCSCVIVR